MQGLAILILIVLFIWLVWPYISRWLRRKAAERTEDFIRQATGMPPRPGSRRAKKQEKEQSRERHGHSPYDGYGADAYSYRERNNTHTDEPLIPKEYAEDVEYVETREYSHETLRRETVSGKGCYKESQVSDAEWVEIKPNTKK